MSTLNEWKFESPAARLYHLIHHKESPKWNKVRTPKGIGTLMKAHSYPGGCQVVLMREKTRINKSKEHPDGVQIMRQFNHSEIEEV